MDECMVDALPTLGTKAAAVAGVESLIHTALRAPGPLEPERLRYWLDAYYQARRAQEDEEEKGAELPATPEQPDDEEGQTPAAAETQQKPEPAAKKQQKRQRPVG